MRKYLTAWRITVGIGLAVTGRVLERLGEVVAG